MAHVVCRIFFIGDHAHFDLCVPARLIAVRIVYTLGNSNAYSTEKHLKICHRGIDFRLTTTKFKYHANYPIVFAVLLPEEMDPLSQKYTKNHMIND
jgi:hypothetical protein